MIPVDMLGGWGGGIYLMKEIIIMIKLFQTTAE
jgi:hypothetical protein